MSSDKSIEAAGMPSWFKDCPIVCDWCKYNGEIYFAVLNWEESEKRKKVILDLAYCATKALNEIFLMQRVYTPKRFQPY